MSIVNNGGGSREHGSHDMKLSTTNPDTVSGST